MADYNNIIKIRFSKLPLNFPIYSQLKIKTFRNFVSLSFNLIVGNLFPLNFYK